MSEPEQRWDVVVLGSANVDLVIAVKALPLPGQTLLASTGWRSTGGKGANQAVAAARAGARTSLHAAMGDDADGRQLQRVLRDSGVELSGVQISSAPTGLAVVLVQESGENCIVVVPGANAELAAQTEPMRCSVLLAQLEVPLTAVISSARAARAQNGRVVLNAAPFQPLPDDLIAEVDLLIVNEQEAKDLAASFASGVSPQVALDVALDVAPDAVLDTLLTRFPEVIITRGGAGSTYGSTRGIRHEIAAPTVTVQDSTGAGDTYCGVLAAALASGLPIAQAMSRATAAAALSVQKSGTIPAIPTAADVDLFMGAT